MSPRTGCLVRMPDTPTHHLSLLGARAKQSDLMSRKGRGCRLLTTNLAGMLNAKQSMQAIDPKP